MAIPAASATPVLSATILNVVIVAPFVSDAVF